MEGFSVCGSPQAVGHIVTQVHSNPHQTLDMTTKKCINSVGRCYSIFTRNLQMYCDLPAQEWNDENLW